MGGRRLDFDGQFQIDRISFWMNDPRIAGNQSSPTEKALLHYVNMVAVMERSEVLPKRWSIRSLTGPVGCDTRSLQRAYIRLKEKCLLGETDDGRIIVYQVSERHGNLKWREKYITPVIASNKSDTDQISTDQCNTKAAPPKSAAAPETQKPKAKPKAAERSPTQIANGTLVEKVKTLWGMHFKGKGQSYAFHQQTLNACREIDISPAWVMRYVGDHGAKDPIKYLRWILKPENHERPSPDESGTSYSAWEASVLNGSKRSGHAQPVALAMAIGSSSPINPESNCMPEKTLDTS